MREALEAKYGSAGVCCGLYEHVDGGCSHYILERILFEFPVVEIHINLPRWIDGLDYDHWLKKDIIDAVRECSAEVSKLKDAAGRWARHLQCNTSLLSNADCGEYQPWRRYSQDKHKNGFG
jgi:hypothetical protein